MLTLVPGDIVIHLKAPNSKRFRWWGQVTLVTDQHFSVRWAPGIETTYQLEAFDPWAYVMSQTAMVDDIQRLPGAKPNGGYLFRVCAVEPKIHPRQPLVDQMNTIIKIWFDQLRRLL